MARHFARPGFCRILPPCCIHHHQLLMLLLLILLLLLLLSSSLLLQRLAVLHYFGFIMRSLHSNIHLPPNPREKRTKRKPYQNQNLEL
jgi:hypothetical protein